MVVNRGGGWTKVDSIIARGVAINGKVGKMLKKLLEQWFLTWVRSSPIGSVSQFQGFGGLDHPHS